MMVHHAQLAVGSATHACEDMLRAVFISRLRGMRVCSTHVTPPPPVPAAGSNVLNAKNESPLRAGQVFTVSLGVSGLTREDAADPRAKTYALLVSRLAEAGRHHVHAYVHSCALPHACNAPPERITRSPTSQHARCTACCVLARHPSIASAIAHPRPACPTSAQIADTVVVKPGGAPPENLCGAAAKAWDKVSYTLNDEQEVRADAAARGALLLHAQRPLAAAPARGEPLCAMTRLRKPARRALGMPMHAAALTHSRACLLSGRRAGCAGGGDQRQRDAGRQEAAQRRPQLQEQRADTVRGPARACACACGIT